MTLKEFEIMLKQLTDKEYMSSNESQEVVRKQQRERSIRSGRGNRESNMNINQPHRSGN